MIVDMAANRIKRVQSLLKQGAFFAMVLASPVLALADTATPKDPVDWRLEGYGDKGSVTLDVSATSLTWMLLVGLGIICIGVLFKNARRTHLD